MTPTTTRAAFPTAFAGLWRPARYKIIYGGRGGAKSWQVARWLLIDSSHNTLRTLCGREYQSSIADSVHKLLDEQIDELKLPGWRVKQNALVHRRTNSEFIFKGFHHNIKEIKSTEGVDRCWMEEAQSVCEESWKVIVPTIRKPGSQIICTYNPDMPEDPTHVRAMNMLAKPHPDGSWVKKVSYRDNPAFPQVLDQERLYMLEVDPDAYEWVWEGNTRQISDAIIFNKRVSVESFETPQGVRLFYGADFGFADDPSTLIRFWVDEATNTLYIDYEAYGHHVELDEMPAFYRSVPSVGDWPVKADCARPETISYLARNGFNISGAAKWDGSVEDGITHLKGFRRIVVHERCKHTAQEFRLYSYKVDKVTQDILPVIVDKHNHCIDAIRYGLDGYIQGRGVHGVWAKLGSK